MTKFNPENKETLTYGEALGPAMEITDPEDAAQYKADYIRFTEKHLTNGQNKSGLTAEEIVNLNIGYYAGYYSTEVRERVECLFNCAHPIFGNIESNGQPSPKEALRAGILAGIISLPRKQN